MRSCTELGLCQNRNPACTGCTCEADTATAKALASAAQASRNAGCCNVLGDEYDFKESLTPCERIAYWGAVGFGVGLSIVTVLGTAGYLSVKLFGI
ncbi:MAG: hypothetical protein E6Q78_05140 [Rhodoferax sp.]|nr:MAG: hypothetical protein E6Q78_05140 [Rhodoferax sp.]